VRVGMCVCARICACMCVHSVCVRVKSMRMYVCVCARALGHMRYVHSVCLRVCVCVCVDICVSACVYMRVYARAGACTCMRVCIYMYIYISCPPPPPRTSFACPVLPLSLSICIHERSIQEDISIYHISEVCTRFFRGLY